MGIFSFLSSNAKAKSFTGQTAEAIINNTKLDKLSEEIVNDEGYSELSEETKNAIQMLLDLKKGKMTIYNKCYAKGQGQGQGVRPASVRLPNARPASMRPVSVRPPNVRPAVLNPPIVHKNPFQKAEPEPAAEETVAVKEEQTGGGRRKRHKRTKRSKKVKKGKTHRRR